MEDGRIVITQEDIADLLLKVNRRGFIALPILLLLLFLFYRFSNWIVPWLGWTILFIAACLLCIFLFVLKICYIFQIKNGTYFTTTTEELRWKDEHLIQVGRDPMRLHFQCCHYDIYHRRYLYDGLYESYLLAYDMEPETFFHTAFIGDTFTLVKVKNSVILAYNNKFFDVQVP